MSQGGYRDPRAGALSHIQEADAAIAERVARMTPALEKMLPEGLMARIRELRAVKLEPDASLEALTRVRDARASLLDALDEALALAGPLTRELRSAADGAPTEPAQDDQWGPVGTEEAMVEIARDATDSAERVDEHARVRVTGARITAEICSEGVALLWIVDLGGAVTTSTSLTPRVTFARSLHRVKMNVSTALPRIALRPERLSDDLLKLLHLETDVDTGDDAFDREFFVEGDAAFVKPLLSAPVRKCLLARAAEGAFQLRVEEGVATLEWSTFVSMHVEPQALRLAVRALVALRESASGLALVRDVTRDASPCALGAISK